MGAWGRGPQYCQSCKKVGQKSAMLQESWPQYLLGNFSRFLATIVGQLGNRPEQKVPRYITGLSVYKVLHMLCFSKICSSFQAYTTLSSFKNMHMQSIRYQIYLLRKS